MATYGGGLFLSQELTQRITGFTGAILPARWGAQGMYHRAEPNLDPGAMDVLVPEISIKGKASFYDGKPYDIPIVDFEVAGKKYPSIIVVQGARWNKWELDSQALANSQNFLPERDIIDTATIAVRSVIRQEIHRLAWAGDPSHNIHGLFSNPGVEIITDTPTPTVHEMNGNQLFNWVQQHLIDFQKATKLTAESMRLMVTTDLFGYLQRPFTNSNGSPLQLLTDASSGRHLSVREIIDVNELQASYLRDERVRLNDDMDRMVILGDIPQSVMGEEAQFAPIIRRHFYGFDRTVPRRDSDFTQTFAGFEITTGVGFDSYDLAKYIDYPKRP